MASLPDIAARLESAAADIAAMGPDLIAGGPWPMADRFDDAPEAAWGPPEVLAHVGEMLPYWLGEIERIVTAPPGDEPVAFGRVAGDAVRIAIIGRDRTIPVPELLARIAADAGRVAARLRALDGTADATRIGLHPRLGAMSMPEIGERFLAGHLLEHVRQLREILDAAA